MTSALQEKTRRLLTQLKGGHRAAADDLLPHVYDELRSLAARQLRGGKDRHTLQPTALVHEAYLRLVDPSSAEWRDRSHFVAVATKAMRQVLIDHFRKQRASKRGGDWRRVSLGKAEAGTPGREVDFLALDEALDRLAALDAQQARVVELRFFGGLTVEEVAEAMGFSKAWVEKEWRLARAWLLYQLRDEGGGGASRDGD